MNDIFMSMNIVCLHHFQFLLKMYHIFYFRIFYIYLKFKFWLINKVILLIFFTFRAKIVLK
jgi:hypothetical protein